MACAAALPAPPAFGFKVSTLDAAAAATAGLTLPGAAGRSAVLVTEVGAARAAEAAGLRAGDMLLAANGHALQDAAQLDLWVRTLAPGQTLLMQLQRQGQVMERTLRRAARP